MIIYIIMLIFLIIGIFITYINIEFEEMAIKNKKLQDRNKELENLYLIKLNDLVNIY